VPPENDAYAKVHEVGAALAQHRSIANHRQLRCICGWQSIDLTDEQPYHDWTAFHGHIARRLLSLFASGDLLPPGDTS
jgi:hypothetical protein